MAWGTTGPTGPGHIKKSRLFWALLVLFFLISTWITVGRANAAESLGFTLDATAGETLSIRVQDEATGLAIEGATIEQVPAGKGTQRITIRKEGYTVLTVIGARKGLLTAHLMRLPAEDASGALVYGDLGGWKNPSFGSVAAGVVFSTVSAANLVAFNLDSFISPIYDEIDVLGPRRIPSNAVMPRQVLYTPLGTVTLDKLRYRLPMELATKARMVGIQGEAGVLDLVAAFQSGEYSVDLLNKLNFRKVGLSDEFDVTGDKRLDFSTTAELRARHRVTPDKPPFTSDVVAIAATDLDGTRRRMVPTDLKSAAKKNEPVPMATVQLSTPSKSLGIEHVVTVAFDGVDRVTGIVSRDPGGDVKPGAFLPASAPAAVGPVPDKVRLEPVAKGLSGVIFERQGNRGVPLWVIYALPSAGTVDVPTEVLHSVDGVPVRYNQVALDFGSAFNESKLDGRALWASLVRFSRVENALAQSETNP